MQKQTRTVLFVICLLVFFLAAPSAILYSQGYRFDFEHKKITQTGAFYAKVLPRGAKIYLNGKLRGTTSFIDSSLLVENLLPGKYAAEIKKDGYRTWEKTLTVREKKVTEAKHVTLFPQDVKFEFSTNFAGINKEKQDEIPDEIPKELIGLNFKDFFISPDKKRVVYFTDHEIMILFLDNQYDLGQAQGNTIFLTRFSEKIDKVIWLNNYYVLFNAGNNIKVTEIDNRDRLNMFDLFEIKNPDIYWDTDAKILYIKSEEKLYNAIGLLP